MNYNTLTKFKRVNLFKAKLKIVYAINLLDKQIIAQKFNFVNYLSKGVSCMSNRPNWTGEAVSKKHLYDISNKELGSKLGVTKEYISMVINGKKTPKDAEQWIMTALDEIIAERESA